MSGSAVSIRSLPQQSPAAPRLRLAEPPSDAQWLEQLAFQHGRSYDSYLVVEPGREYFWSKYKRGVIAFIRSGKYLNVGGGLLAPEAHKAELLAEFSDFVRQENLIASFYNISEEDKPFFQQQGFQCTKWGEDAVLELHEQTWSGKPFEWVRRQANFCRRQGVTWSECLHEERTESEWQAIVAELHEISSARLATKPQQIETGFLDGRFDPDWMGRKRIFIARSATRIEGFLICNPCLGGCEWSLEMYRQRPDGIRGTITFLMLETLKQFQREGILRASLCLVPALRCDEPQPGDSWLIRYAMKTSHFFNFIYDVRGLYHFKSRFRPQFESRYICVFPRATLGSMRAFTRVSGALDLSPRKMLSCMWDHLKKWSRRSTLATPHEHGE